jgi:hypothetical protein
MKKIIILFMMILSTVSYSQVATPPANIELCDDDYDGLAQFDLDSQTAQVLDGQDPTKFIISYHNSLEDAESYTNTLISPYTNSTANVQTIYVRVTDSVTNDYTITTFDIIVNELPITTFIDDLEGCDDDDDGLTQFDLESQTAQILGSQDPTQFIVSYYNSLYDALVNTNTLISPYTNSTANAQTIFVRITNTETGCFTTNNFSLIVNNCSPTFNWSSDDYYITSNGNQGISKTINDLTIQVYHTNSNSDLIVEDGYILTNNDNSSNEIIIEYSNQVNLKSTLLSSKDGSNVGLEIEHFREDGSFIVRQNINGIDDDYDILTNYDEIKKSEFDFDQNNWKIGRIVINSFTLNTQYFSLKNMGLPYPNPTKSIITLNSSKDYKIEIFNMTGIKVKETIGSTIDMSTLKNAVYLLSIMDKETKEKISYKVVKN